MRIRHDLALNYDLEMSTINLPPLSSSVVVPIHTMIGSICNTSDVCYIDECCTTQFSQEEKFFAYIRARSGTYKVKPAPQKEESPSCSIL